MDSEPSLKHHPAEENIRCPVTGLPIHSRPEWTFVDCGDGFRATVYVIGDDIVVCRPYGHATAKAIAISLDLAGVVIREIVGIDRPYIKIEDYAELGRIPSDARKRFIKYVKSETQLKCQIFCNVSNLMRLSIKLGKSVAMIPVQMEITGTFEEALYKALATRNKPFPAASKQRIKYSADPFAEYESAGICSVSGLEITKRVEWTAIPVGRDSQASFQWIGPRILHVVLQGRIDVSDIKVMVRHKIRAVADWLEEKESYVEIIDATAAAIGRESRLFSLFQPRMNQAPVAGIIIQTGFFYTVEAVLRRLFMPIAPKVKIAGNYEEAILKAQKILRRSGYDQKPPYESLALEDWKLTCPGLNVNFEIINTNVLHGVYAGSMETDHIEALFDLHSRIIEHMGPPPEGYAVATGIRNLRSVSPASRKGFIENILKLHQRFPINQYIFYGANPQLRAVVNLSRPLIPFPVRMVKDLDSALKLVAQGPTRALTGRAVSRPSSSELANLKRYAEDLIQYTGSINWEEAGMEADLMQVDPLNPLRPVYEAIALIKMDLDYLHRKRDNAERSLIESEKKYRTVLDSMNEGYFETGLNHALVFFNDATCRIFGYRQEELMGMDIRVLLDSVDRNTAIATFDHVKNTGGPYQRVRWQYRRKNGGTCHIETSIIPILDSVGHTTGFRGLFRDVTQHIEDEAEKRHLEIQLQQAHKMEALGTLAGGVAHDLNNLLTGLVGYPDLLLSKLPPDSPARKGLEAIRKSGQKAATIVQDLLTLARRGVAAMEILNLNQIIMEYMESPEFANLIGHHKGIEIKLDLAPNLLNMSGSDVHLSKVVMNLVANAAEAMPAGGTLRICTRNFTLEEFNKDLHALKPGEHVVMTVADTGIGMSAEDRRHIFEPFYTKKALGRSGTGLGMAVVWGAVKDHNGHITLTSEMNKGTQISVYFPADRGQPALENIPDPIETYRGNGERILVVDDLALQRELLCEMLDQLGYTAKSVASGEAAVEYLQDHSAELVILDMIMDPGIDGYETYRRILKKHPQQKAFLCSGFSESQRIRMARQLGAGPCLKKPFTLEQLGKAIRMELEK
jgi:PAS domain S-box-containing protein